MSRRRRALLPFALLLPALALARQAADGPAPGPGPAVQFMGVEVAAAAAERVAFVCDGSRWTETKDEELFAALLRAVKPFAPPQQFAVIFFADDQAWGPDDGRPMPATDENKARLRHWLDDLELGRDSTPAPGFKLAFEGKPDAVFFVSDGHFERYDEVARLVTSLNAERAVRVHAVGYFRSEEEDDSRRFVGFMKGLAEANGGTSRIAYADEMRRRAE